MDAVLRKSGNDHVHFAGEVKNMHCVSEHVFMWKSHRMEVTRDLVTECPWGLVEHGLMVGASCAGFAAWITARLYEAGLEDPSSLTEGAWPVAQLGSTLAVALPASAAFFTGGRILIQATLRAAATSRRPAQDFRRMSKQAVEASQQVDLRTAADFKAGRRLSSLQSEDTPESQPGGDSPPGSQQAEAAASKAESSPEGKGASSSGKPRSRKVPPELAELLQRVQGMARERSSGAPSRDIFALVSVWLTSLMICHAKSSHSHLALSRWRF